MGTAGSPGTSGTSGTSGIGAVAATAGTSGTSGSAGTNGTSGFLVLTGATDNGLLTLNGSAPNSTVEDNLTFDGGGLKLLTVSGSIDLYSGIRLIPNKYPPNATAGMLYASGGLAGQSYLMFHNGSAWVTVSTY
jgi:hypothetical protein